MRSYTPPPWRQNRYINFMRFFCNICLILLTYTLHLFNNLFTSHGYLFCTLSYNLILFILFYIFSTLAIKLCFIVLVEFLPFWYYQMLQAQLDISNLISTICHFSKELQFLLLETCTRNGPGAYGNYVISYIFPIAF